MAEAPWLYLYDGKLKGIGIDLVAEQQVLAFSEAAQASTLVARGRLSLPHVTNRTWGFPPTKLLSWLPSQDYYALNKRFFSQLGRAYLDQGHYRGVIAWSKSALRLFEAAARQGIPRYLNVGNYHCDFDAGGTRNPTRWPRIERARLREEYALASKILVASDYAAHTFVANGIPSEKLAIIYRGVDTTLFHPNADRPVAPFIVASCGSLGERKGTHALLRAWSKAGLPAAELWLIGTIPASEASALQALADPSVRFLGFRRDLPQLMAQVHAHVLLSRNEGFAKVLLEAAACAVVNVCTKETGWPSEAPGALMINNRHDIDEVSTALDLLYRDRDRLTQLGKNARAWVEDHATWLHFRARFRSALSLPVATSE